MTDQKGVDITRREGLCDTCRHAQEVLSARGSRFTLCALSTIDPHYPKYPRLPVLQCSGYDEAAGESPQGSHLLDRSQ